MWGTQKWNHFPCRKAGAEAGMGCGMGQSSSCWRLGSESWTGHWHLCRDFCRAEVAHARPTWADCPEPHPDVFWRYLGWKTPQSSSGKIPLNALLSKFHCIFSCWWHEHLCSFSASYLKKKIPPSLHLPRAAACAGSSLVHAGCGCVREQCACRWTSGVIWKLVCFIPASVANRND